MSVRWADPQGRMAGLTALAVLTVAGCTDADPLNAFEWDLPTGFPSPAVPDDNPMSDAKVELGRWLFYDPALSASETQSCASCHDQSIAFTDPRGVSVGSTGEVLPRNAMALVNVVYNSSQTWSSDVLVHLEQQALIPMFGETPVELGLAGMEDELLDRLRESERYPAMLAAAFGDREPTVERIVQALSAFQRTMISGRSRFDRFWYDRDPGALTASEQRGLTLFLSERLECFHCHGGFNFVDASTHAGSAFIERPFHNTGLYNLDADGAYPSSDRGLYDATGIAEDMGRFKAPTLRNIAVTAPYMHDGSVPTLEAVIDHYAAGGRTIEDGEYAGVGKDNPYKSSFVKGFVLTADERQDLLAFLESLTDETFLTTPALASPFEGSAP